MNDAQNSIPDPAEDPFLNEILSPLKDLRPPREAQIASRVAVAAELRRLAVSNQTDRLPWWRRSISVPVPIAASILVLTAIALSSLLRDGTKAAPTVETAAHQTQSTTAAAKSVPKPEPVLEYYASETYLCGIGRLSSESGFRIQEQN